MKNFTETGDSFAFTAPYPLTSGQGVLVGALFGVAFANYALNETNCRAGRVGTADLTKEPSLVIAFGVRVFWDNTNRRVTTTTTGNFCIGWAAEAAAGADTTVSVLLGNPTAAGA
jgi:predicted RecA/RadA family phage recombinase